MIKSTHSEIFSHFSLSLSHIALLLIKDSQMHSKNTVYWLKTWKNTLTLKINIIGSRWCVAALLPGNWIRFPSFWWLIEAVEMDDLVDKKHCQLRKIERGNPAQCWNETLQQPWKLRSVISKAFLTSNIIGYFPRW